MKHAKKLKEKKVERKQKLGRALDAFHAGETYAKAAADAGISVSALYRYCRAEALRRKDTPFEGLRKLADQAK